MIFTTGRREIYLKKEDNLVKFEGHNITGFCKIIEVDWINDNKYTFRKYKLLLQPGVEVLEKVPTPPNYPQV